MFTTDQILTATKLLRNFPRFSRLLQREPQALLITQKGGNHVVLVSAEMFQDLVRGAFSSHKLITSGESHSAD